MISLPSTPHFFPRLNLLNFFFHSPPFPVFILWWISTLYTWSPCLHCPKINHNLPNPKHVLNPTAVFFTFIYLLMNSTMGDNHKIIFGSNTNLYYLSSNGTSLQQDDTFGFHQSISYSSTLATVVLPNFHSPPQSLPWYSLPLFS